MSDVGDDSWNLHSSKGSSSRGLHSTPMQASSASATVSSGSGNGPTQVSKVGTALSVQYH